MTRLHLSWGELHFQVCRAAFGTGLPWGLAEDTAHTAAWLARYGIDPAPQLARLLGNIADGSSATALRLMQRDDISTLHADDQRPLSALVAGPSAADWWDILADRPAAQLKILRGDAPGWVAATIAQRHEIADPNAVRQIVDSPTGDLLISDRFWTTTATDGHEMPEVVTVAADDWRVVRDFFRRSLVPSTDASRHAGAGAGLVDRD
ncbi:MAG: DUF3726 domain-containing protein [Minwuia sp.]|nr:DUF3726 domain-containing protein [Minwuia sp.]